jgi:hypothetical protein
MLRAGLVANCITRAIRLSTIRQNTSYRPFAKVIMINNTDSLNYKYKARLFAKLYGGRFDGYIGYLKAEIKSDSLHVVRLKAKSSKNIYLYVSRSISIKDTNYFDFIGIV